VDDRIAFGFLSYSDPSSYGSDELNIIGSDGGGRVRLSFPSPSSRASFRAVAWSPDGTMLAVGCFAFTGNRQYLGITIVSPSGQVLYQLTDLATRANTQPTWSPLSGRVSAVQQASWGQIKGLFLAAPDTARGDQ
jgi:hypothetical protein